MIKSKTIEHRSPALSLPGRILDFGISLPKDMSFEDWQAVAQDAQLFWKNVPWIVGDILAYGARRWPDVWEQAVEFTDRSNETLRKYMQVAEKFPEARRRFKLSFTYYQRVAFLEPGVADALLERCADGELNTTDLAQEVSRLSVTNNRTARKVVEASDPEPEGDEDDDTPIADKGAVGAAFSAEDRREVLDASRELHESTATEKLRFHLAGIKALRDDPSFREELDVAVISASDCELEGHWLVNLGRECRHRQNIEFDNPRSARKAVLSKAGADGGGGEAAERPHRRAPSPTDDFDPLRDMPENLRKVKADG